MIFFFDRLENIAGKRENADYQHFLLFPQCFQRAFYPGSLKVVIVWSRVNSPLYPFTKQQNNDWTKFKAFAEDKINDMLCLDIPENIVGKGENAGILATGFFSCFYLQCFSTLNTKKKNQKKNHHLIL